MSDAGFLSVFSFIILLFGILVTETLLCLKSGALEVDISLYKVSSASYHSAILLDSK